jgi:hypothetical protein
VSQSASRYRATVIDRWGPPVGVVFIQSPRPHARVSSSVKFPSLSRPHIECSHHLNAHLSTCRREPSHRLLMSCSVASTLPAVLLPPVTAPAGMPTPGAQRRSLAPPAMLAKLTQPKVHRLGLCIALPMSSSPSDVGVQTKSPPLRALHDARCRYTSVPRERPPALPHCRSTAAPSRHLPPSLLAQAHVASTRCAAIKGTLSLVC